MRRLTTLLTGIAGIALFAMMVLTFADVFARKFLPNSIRGAVQSAITIGKSTLITR